MRTHIHGWHDTRGFKFGAVAGALVFTYAGAAWAFMALGTGPSTPPGILSLFALPVLGLTIGSAVRFVALWKQPRQSMSAAEAAESARLGRRAGILFGMIFAAEGILIGGTAVLLARSHRSLLIPVAVVGIVGLHFLPLARVFWMPIYTLTGALLSGMAVMPLLITDEASRVFFLAIAVALVLWASAASVLATYTAALPAGQDLLPRRS